MVFGVHIDGKVAKKNNILGLLFLLTHKMCHQTFRINGESRI